ncbi:FkbM family methyltransferase [Agrobacterium sp. O3.4]|uniref:FkbM family methyltransferase n=2 Tax=Rhizobium/Agrobacterium group TaxID=227290 RepID=A0A546XE85_RHIRH|nr:MULTISPECIES: FkbM family methyltransferase [Rhizobium/Agrobacterium group]MCZ7470055.1 FkbM family methyltransferase [Rhizobium rhizogenes]TRA99048.1 FkbM family methyltransferase [Rhizobium rhizogenes]WHO11327.1 FkbM family methyltransferase [Agrobacterium cucumeris]
MVRDERREIVKDLSDFRVRNCISLKAFSALTRIIRYSGYSNDFPATQESFWILHRDVQEALRNNKPEWIYNDELYVEIDGVQKSVTVDMRNTQFIGADLEVAHFRNGYEPDILFCIDRFVPHDGVYVDIGANWGYFPVYLSTRPGFSGQCVAIEPAPRASRDLQQIVSSLDIDDRVSTHSVAVSDSSGKVRISDELWTGNNSISGVVEDASPASAEVDCTTLDILLQDGEISRIDLIKIDVEGVEDAVLRGAKDTIKKFEPVIIFENWISQSEEKTLAPFLQLSRMSLGYEFFIIEMREKSQFTFSPAFIKIDTNRRNSYEDRLNVIALPSKKFGLLLENL